MSRTVLIVDDEPSLRLVVRMILEPRFAVAEAATGEEALTLLADGKPCLVLLDIRLPGIDGLEVLRRIRADERLAGVGVVMMSAHTSPSTLAAAREEGSDGYIVKPFRDADVIAAAERFCAPS